MNTIKIHNVETGEIIEREMNAQELQEFEQFKLDEKLKEAEAQAKAESKAQAEAKLVKLGFTIDDLRALGL